jgi:hypothetical protein
MMSRGELLTMFVLAAVGATFGLWKVVEMLYFFFSHITIGWN